MRLIFAALLSMATCQGLAVEIMKPSPGRYAISGDWRLDTMTGHIERISVIYDQQMRAAAKEIEEMSGGRVISIEGYRVNRSLEKRRKFKWVR